MPKSKARTKILKKNLEKARAAKTNVKAMGAIPSKKARIEYEVPASVEASEPGPSSRPTDPTPSSQKLDQLPMDIENKKHPEGFT